MDTQEMLEKAKELAHESGMTYREIGVAMGIPSDSARQWVYRFLNSKNPSWTKVVKFSEAIGVEARELL
jgi:transcriptional regulator with XRE-family HTH domain